MAPPILRDAPVITTVFIESSPLKQFVFHIKKNLKIRHPTRIPQHLSELFLDLYHLLLRLSHSYKVPRDPNPHQLAPVQKRYRDTNPNYPRHGDPTIRQNHGLQNKPFGFRPSIQKPYLVPTFQLSPVTVRKLFAQQPLDSRLRTLVPLLDLLKTERSRHAPQSRLSLDRGPPTHLQADQKSR